MEHNFKIVHWDVDYIINYPVDHDIKKDDFFLFVSDKMLSMCICTSVANGLILYNSLACKPEQCYKATVIC